MRLVTSILPTALRFSIPTTIRLIVISPLIPVTFLKPPSVFKSSPTWILLELLLLSYHQWVGYTSISFVMNESAVLSFDTALMTVEVFAWDGFVLISFHLRIWLKWLVEMWSEFITW